MYSNNIIIIITVIVLRKTRKGKRERGPCPDGRTGYLGKGTEENSVTEKVESIFPAQYKKS